MVIVCIQLESPSAHLPPEKEIGLTLRSGRLPAAYCQAAMRQVPAFQSLFG